MLTACEGELPNPHKNCLRELLNSLACYSNTYQRLYIEMKRLQQEYKTEMDAAVFPCSEMRKHNICMADERVKQFQKKVENIDLITQCFDKRLNDMEMERNKLVQDGAKCLKYMREEKCKMQRFHERTIDHLKTLMAHKDNAKVIRNCQRDIDELSRRFIKEIAYVKKCEQVLQPFLKVLENCDNELVCDCQFKEYDWLPEGKNLNVVSGIVEEIKQTMGTTLKRAFAQVHIQKPFDVRKFLSAYIIHMQNSEEFMKEKLRLFELPK